MIISKNSDIFFEGIRALLETECRKVNDTSAMMFPTRQELPLLLKLVCIHEGHSAFT